MTTSANSQLFEYQVPTNLSTASKDGLFLERLETFLEKSLSEIRAFAEREEQSYDETRRYVAQWHAKYLFQPSTSTGSSTQSAGSERTERIRPILCDTSRILEALSTSWGVHSFLLAVDPYERSDAGFLGGSLLGREFWRGLRGGGDTGARSFRIHCTTQLQVQQKDIKPIVTAQQTAQPSSTPSLPKANPAKSLKNELYESVRNELRSASGVRTAEMKWTNPERLDMYGVRLVGWPKGIPAQNPSSLKSSQNRQLLEALQKGSLRFERLATHQSSAPEIKEPINEQPENGSVPDDLAWAYDIDAGQISSLPPESSSSSISPNTMPSNSSSSDFTQVPTLITPSIQEPENYPLDQLEWNLADPSLIHSSYDPDPLWDTMFNPAASSPSLDSRVWENGMTLEQHDQCLDSERPRKRQRSEEAVVYGNGTVDNR